MFQSSFPNLQNESIKDDFQYVIINIKRVDACEVFRTVPNIQKSLINISYCFGVGGGGGNQQIRI